jgi:nucleoid DNA-binding protein
MAKGKESAKAPSKTEVVNNIAEATGLSKKDVVAVFDSLSTQIKNAIGKRGPGLFAIPGLCKITIKVKPATKERKGIDPFTKQERVFKAKPARTVVRVKPLKALKDMVG